jgi:hypothetical protein
MLSILIISRSPQNLETVLRSISESKDLPELEVLVSWNGKTAPPSFKDVERNINVNYYQIMPYNFAQNNNTLAKYASGDYLLFLNDDMRLDRDCITKSLREINKPEVGIVGANLRYADDKVQHAGIFLDKEFKPYHIYKHELHWQDAKVSSDQFVPAVTGAFLLIRRTEFLSIKFDERFVVAGEDVVLCLAYRKKFQRGVLYCADATAVHFENVTRRETEERLTPPEDVALISESAKQDVGGVPLSSVKRPRVRIVTEKEGWIMHRKAAEIRKHFGEQFAVINEDWAEADIHYYINYGYFNKRPRSGLLVANFTHLDPELHRDKFIEVAFTVDHCTSVSKNTSMLLYDIGVPDSKVTTIRVGADSSFRPMLTLGVCGRPYKGGRKGEDILKAVLDDTEIIRDVRIVAMNPDWGLPTLSVSDPADFYRAVDFLLVTSRIEGGPVPVMEALACGTLAIAPPIGVVPEFPHVPYQTGNIQSLKSTIHRLVEEMKTSRGEIARPMQRQNWAGWSVRHEKLFRRMLLGSPLS